MFTDDQPLGYTRYPPPAFQNGTSFAIEYSCEETGIDAMSNGSVRPSLKNLGAHRASVETMSYCPPVCLTLRYPSESSDSRLGRAAMPVAFLTAAICWVR